MKYDPAITHHMGQRAASEGRYRVAPKELGIANDANRAWYAGYDSITESGGNPTASDRARMDKWVASLNG